jgi:2-oxoisovalerate dehydrogenase E1 component beta subunit
MRWARCPRATTRCRWSRPRCFARQPAHRAGLRHHGLRGEAAARETGIDAEIIDLRSLWPLDLDTIVASVKKTGRCVVVHEATRTCGFGAELLALVQEHCFYHLEAPIERVTGWDTPYPHAQEWLYFPGPARVGAAFLRAMEA